MNNNFIAITGSVSCGKSTSLSFFKKHGVKVFSADQIVEKLYMKNDTVKLFRINKLEKFINNNKIDKNLLKKKFFNNKKLKKKIESLIHPLVLNKILELKAKHNIAIVEVPLLFEANIEKYFNTIICIYLDPQVALQRLMKKFNLDKDEASKIILSQMSINQKIIKSNLVIINNQSIEILEKKIIQAVYVLKNIPKPKRIL